MATRRAGRKRVPVKRLWALAALLLLAGCREVRVKTYSQGTTPAAGSNQFSIVRDAVQLERLGIKAPVRFRGEFGVVLLMGPHTRTGYHQIIESIRASDERVRVVAFEATPAPTAANPPRPIGRIRYGLFRTRSIVGAYGSTPSPQATNPLPRWSYPSSWVGDLDTWSLWSISGIGVC